MSETAFNPEDYGLNQAGNVEIQDALADFVKKCFHDAYQHKQSTGIEGRLLRNLRANKCEYQPEELAMIEPGTDIYMGIPALKARAAESWLTDIILNNIDKPWTISPTPDPELRDELKEQVVDQLISELPTLNGVAAVKDRARELKSVQTKIAFSEAEKANDRMSTVINDQMTEGDWIGTFQGVIADIVVQPTVTIRGPFLVGKTMGVWDGNEYKAKKRDIPVSRVISAFDAFPSPDSKDTQNGQYFCERTRYSQGSLHALIGVEGFNSGNIRQVIDRYTEGYDLSLFADAERRRLEDTVSTDAVTPIGRAIVMYDTIIFNGRVKGELLADHGIVVKDKQATYECEVWKVGDYVIKAVLNPNPSGKRPIHSTSYRKIAGSYWGQSVIDLVYDVGRVCNATARNLVKNMGYAGGPIGEVVAERVVETQDPTDVRPYRIVFVGPDTTGTGAPAYKFHNVQSISAELIGVFNQFMKYADDLSGVPSYVLGNPQVAGAGRTLGGLSMLMGNAAKGIKNVQLNIDREIIAPLVEGYYVYNMVTSDDDSIKADCTVVARGATGLLQRELAQTRTIEILQLLTPYIQNWDNMADGIKVLLREVLKSTGLPVDDIIANPNSDREGRDLLGLLAGSAGALNSGTNNPPALPPQSMPTPMPSGGPMAPVNLATGA